MVGEVVDGWRLSMDLDVSVFEVTSSLLAVDVDVEVESEVAGIG